MDGYLSGWVAGAKLGVWVDGYLSGWVTGVIWISFIQINSKIVKVYRKSGRVSYLQKFWD